MERHFKFLIKFCQLFSLNPTPEKFIRLSYSSFFLLFCRIYCIIEVIITCLACSSVKLTYHHTRSLLSRSLFLLTGKDFHSFMYTKSLWCYCEIMLMLSIIHNAYSTATHIYIKWCCALTFFFHFRHHHHPERIRGRKFNSILSDGCERVIWKKMTSWI